MVSRYFRVFIIAILIVTIAVLYYLFQNKNIIYEKYKNSFDKQTSNPSLIIQNKESNLKVTTIIPGTTKTSTTTLLPTSSNSNSSFGQPNVYKVNDEPENYQIAYLKSSSGSMPIYVYSMSDLISRDILRSHSWEAGYISAMEEWMTKTPDLNLIDVGCNLGVYTLVAAKRGRRAIAVDANINNIRRLSKSVHRNNLQDKVTIVYNGISDVYTYFSVSSPDPGNIGHSMIIKSDKANNQQTKLKTLYMDDLLKVIDFKKAILKIDIEGHEVEAFRKADKLFTNIDIVAVMIEWRWLRDHRDPNVPLSVKNFFNKHGYKAYASLNSGNPLNQEAYKSWPVDVVWKKV